MQVEDIAEARKKAQADNVRRIRAGYDVNLTDFPAYRLPRPMQAIVDLSGNIVSRDDRRHPCGPGKINRAPADEYLMCGNTEVG